MAHTDDVAAAQSALQQAHRAATTDAQHQAADAAYRAALIAAGRKWGVKNGAMKAALDNHDVLPAGSIQPREM